jgi:hypothetical protein
LDQQNESYKKSIKKIEQIAISAKSDSQGTEGRLTPNKFSEKEILTAKHRRKLLLRDHKRQLMHITYSIDNDAQSTGIKLHR